MTDSRRSTIYLDPDLHRALRLKAAESECSISDLVNAAVRSALAAEVPDDRAEESAGPYGAFVDSLKRRGLLGETATISASYQVVIPRSVRDRLHLSAGQTVQVFPFGERLELVPVRPASALRGILRGLDTRFERDEEDRV